MRAAAGAPTALSGQEPWESRLVEPFYDILAYSKYSLVVGTVARCSHTERCEGEHI